MQRLLCGEEIDRHVSWPIGRAEKLARRGKLPHVKLPDGAIRFEPDSIERLLQRVNTVTSASSEATDA